MSTKNVFKLNDTHDRVVAGTWITYDASNDFGQLWGWGLNTVGQVGDNSTINRSSPVQIPGNNWCSVSASDRNFSFGIKTNNTLWAWGCNHPTQGGVLGLDVGTASYQSPNQVPGTNWLCINAGYQHSLALKRDNTLWAWGRGQYGRLGDNTQIQRSSPIQIPGTAWCGISAFSYNSLGLKTDGTLWSWGYNNFGQLGIDSRSIAAASSPIQIPGNSWVQVGPCFGRKSDGTLWAWGINQHGQLGLNDLITRSSPSQIPGTSWNDICQSRGLLSAGRKTDGTLWTWGRGYCGGRGDDTAGAVHRCSPVQVPGNSWRGLTLLYFGGLATKTDGTLWSWGYNNNGQLGHNSTIQRSSPVQVPGTSWVKIDGGRYHSLAIKSYSPPTPYDVLGTHLWSWGYNATGTVGDNTTIDRSSPVLITGSLWTQVTGACHSLARKSDGTLWAWGSIAAPNNCGQLGDNSVVPKSSPVQIPGTNWCHVDAGQYHSFGLKNDGTLWAWGSNYFLTLGDGTSTPKSSPIQIPGVSWSDVASSRFASFGRKTDGTLWAWGNNGCGTLGDGTVIQRNSPVQIPGTSWTEISPMYLTSLARKSDGTLWSWGNASNYGLLGVNDSIHRSSPVQIPGTNWNDISKGIYVALARKNDGTLWSWGRGYQGRLGNNSDTNNRSSPVQIPGTQWCDMTNGRNASFAIKTDGTLWGWGRNYRGILADGTTINRCSPTQIPGNCWLRVSSNWMNTLAIKCFTG